MSPILNQIQNHQRILITGERAYEILSTCRQVLDAQKKPYDLLTDREQSIKSAPMVFIVSSTFTDYDPHIVLIDAVSNEDLDKFNQLVEGLPKSGTLVYNSNDSNTLKIGKKELVDVHKEEYEGDDINSAARTLVRRIGISEEMFNKSL